MSEVKTRSDDYTKAVERASLEAVSLQSSSFSSHHDFHDEQEAADKFIDQEVVEPHYDAKSGYLMGHVRCRVWMNKGADNAKSGEKSPDEYFATAIFAVEAKYLVVFRIPGEHKEETTTAFFNRMAPFSVWPYFRTHVSGIAAEANLEVPILPIKKLFQPVKSAGGYVDPDFKGETGDGG